MSKFSRGATAVRFRWWSISRKRTHDEPVIQHWLRPRECLHTSCPAPWPDALGRTGGNLATVQQPSGDGARGLLSCGLPRALTRWQPPWRKCAVKLQSGTQKNGQCGRHTSREGGALREIGKEQRKSESSVESPELLSCCQLYQLYVTTSPRITLPWHDNTESESWFPTSGENHPFVVFNHMLRKTRTCSYWPQISLWITGW